MEASWTELEQELAINIQFSDEPTTLKPGEHL